MAIAQRYLGPTGEAEDRYWMRRALAAARRGLGATAPNPPVGAVIVRDGFMLAQGFHAQAGGPHAEVAAFSALAAPGDARGATLYVTLEPCSTHGRTPPCCEAIRAHGVARVIYGSQDPNPSHAGRGARLLEESGIEVSVGVLAAETDALIRVFAHTVTHQTPYVIAKAGLSLDGCLTRPPGESTWLTSPAARRDAQSLRLLVDGILVGAETLRQDDPQLTLRLPNVPPAKRPLRRFILTRSGDIPSDARVFTDPLAELTEVVHDVNWSQWLPKVRASGVGSLLIEGGGNTLTQALQAGAVHELHVYLAPLVSGSGQRLICQALNEAVTLEDVRFGQIGDNVKVSAKLTYDSRDE